MIVLMITSSYISFRACKAIVLEKEHDWQRDPTALFPELFLDQPIQMLRDRRLIEALDHFVEKTGDDQPLGGFGRDAPGTKIEELIFIDLAACCTVSAADVIGQDFEAGHGVGLGFVAQEKISHFLIGISEMRVRLDPDQAAEGGSGAIIQRVLVKQIAGGAGRDVVLQGPGVELLFVLRDRDSE